MTTGVVNFNGSAGGTEDVWIHVSELLTQRFMLDLTVLDLPSKYVMSPNGLRHPEILPPPREASIAVHSTFNKDVSVVLAGLMKEFAQPMSNIPRTIEENGVTRILTSNERDQILALHGMKAQSVISGCNQAINEGLDAQFDFLPFIDGEDLSFALSRISFIGDDKNLMQARRLIVTEQYRACEQAVRHHVSSDWVVLKTDHGLASRIQRHVAGKAKLVGFEYTP